MQRLQLQRWWCLPLQFTVGLVAFVLFEGCQSQSSPYDALVQGSVTIDGQLAGGGVVSFYPKSGPAAVGEIAQNGSYSLRIGQGNVSDRDQSKIPSGEYVATVLVTGAPAKDAARPEGGPLPLGPRLMADKYADRQTSNLAFEVKRGLNVIDLKLEGPSANPPKAEEEGVQPKPAVPQQESQDGSSDRAGSHAGAGDVDRLKTPTGQSTATPAAVGEKANDTHPTSENSRAEDVKR